MIDICYWTACETLERIRNRDIGIAEVVDAHLERIHQVNPTVNAICELDDSAVELARTMDGKTEPGKNLFGLPVTSKSNADQQGFANSNGVPAFAGNICDSDSAVVANLKDSGAITVGRTNTPEFSMRWFTSNPLHGVSLNPWNHAITPGGSSGAAAAAVVTGMCSIAHGNDLGGSLRYPAFCCGVTSLKPSAGRVPAYNPSAPAERPALTQSMSVQGPIARTVADARAGFDAMKHQSINDPLWAGPARASALADLFAQDKKLRVGIAMNPFDGPLDSAIERAMQTAVRGLRDAGADVFDVSVPGADTAARLWGELLFTETALIMGDAIREHGSRDMLQLIEGYQACFDQLDMKGLLNAMSERISQQRKWALLFADIDVLLMPTSLSRPFPNDQDFLQPESIPAIINAQKPLYAMNLLGLPGIAVPTHIDEGVPVGVQLVAARNNDEFLLDVADMLENQIGTLYQELAKQQVATHQV